MGIDQWRELCPSLRVVELPDNTFAYRQGESCRAVYLIVSGHIKLSRLNAQGEEYTMVIVPHDDLCGAPLSGDSALTAADSATSKGRTQLYQVPHGEFMSALSQEPRAAAFAMERLARREAFLADRIEQLLNGNVRARIAAVLTQLTSTYGGRCTHGHEVDIRLTQQELAEMAGASRPTVSTLLAQLRRADIVSYTRHYICIENRSALGTIATTGDTTL